MEQLQNLPFLSIAGAVEYQAKMRPEKTALLYPNPNTNSTEYASLTYKQLNNAANHLAEKFSKYLSPDSSTESVICGILAAGGIKYFLSQYALLKLRNVIMFPISERNSQSAIEHLLRTTKTSFLLSTRQYLPMIETMQQQNELQSLKILLLDNDEFSIEKLLENKDIECSLTLPADLTKPESNEEINKIIVILHSSGSTGHPKPIFLTNRCFLLSFFLYASVNEMFIEEDDVILTWGSLFHLFAFGGSVRSIMKGSTYALPLFSTFPPKPDQLVRNIQAENGITVLVTVPILLEQLVKELLSEKSQNVGLKPLQKLKFIIYGGAVCPNDLCTMLVDNGVVLLSDYGSTETGVILLTNFNHYDKRWNFMQLPDIRKPFVRIETFENAQNPNQKVLVHLPNDPFLAENISSSPDGCFTCGDILFEDPPNSGRYLVLGRQDDILVHNNGEKTNPLPMEAIIRRSPFVKQVVIVGQDQLCTAALIQLNVDEVSNYDINEIEETIWKAVEQANKEAPSQSRLVRQLIKILPIDKMLPVTAKGNLMRRKINQEYFTLINQLYDEFFNPQLQKTVETNNPQNQSKWTSQAIEQYLEEKLKFDSGIRINYSCSIFDYGITSLQTNELRNLICQDICQVPRNFLYEYSSIDQITEKLMKYLNSGYFQTEENDPFHYKLTERIIEKYIDSIKAHNISLIKHKENEKSERIFLITGANGSLGSFIIRDLLQLSKSTVKRVYCLLRGSDTQQRMLESFQQRQLESSLLIESLNSRLIVLPSSMNLNDEYLGQADEVYKELQNQVTDIIHLAWKMDFNQTIKDFESDCIFGVYNLLKLAASNSIKFHFISSVSAAGSGLLPNVKEEPLPRNAEIALAQGYGQSKYASEHLCLAAAKFWNVAVNIYRVDQISGDTKNGVWNINEMNAMMIYAGAQKLKMLPNIGEDIHWIPVDICSAALIDLVLRTSFETLTPVKERVYHLINPYVTKYQDYLNCLREAGLSFETVTPKEFLDAILSANDINNPLIKLSSFLTQRFNEINILRSSKFETVKTVQRCKILKNCPQIDSNLIKLYLKYWQRCQVLNQIL